MCAGTHFHDSYLYLKALFEEQAVNEVEGLYWLLGLQPLPKSYFPPGSPISHHGGNNLMRAFLYYILHPSLLLNRRL